MKISLQGIRNSEKLFRQSFAEKQGEKFIDEERWRNRKGNF